MDSNDKTEDDGKPKQPSPAVLEVFLPWACAQLQVKDSVVVTKIVQTDYVSVVGLSDRSKKKAKSKVSKVELTLDMDKDDRSCTTMRMSVASEIEPGIQIFAFYDSVDNLVQLRYDKNRHLPRIIFKILGMIIQFHPYLHTITINSGIDQTGIYEISKFLPLSHITDLCLDGTFIEESNYHILLENVNCLRHLSLARCSVNDEVLEQIASCLSYPLPASRTLSILNLSSNKITDLGAKHLSEALRSNRQMSYLNLSGNMLTDSGAGYLFNTLLKFPLSFAELLASRSRHMTYLMQKNALVMQKVKELRAGDFEKRAARRKTAVKPISTPKKDKKGVEKEPSLRSFSESKSYGNFEAVFIEKATQMAEAVLGEFHDPFDGQSTVISEGVVYSQGNNTLCYLNLSFNNLSYVSLTKLLKVLTYQKESGRKPRGLVNISIEGNLMPVMCRELQLIDDMLDTGLMLQTRRYSLPKKRTQSKVGTKF
ncbi:uncharacterized protein LOC114351500 [Ostrinia furnacalis]|uniref:uncharacterized protein LOC114351500 n=1 Tax=Ostrinia furnacalis TaxID=93504 RepID=UPI00103B45FC|nr:uncharacterized protein LOC114351500 [Ostrinia furnacalis]